MVSIQAKVLARLTRPNRTGVVTPKDFLDLGNRDAVDQAMHRLVRKGALTRLGRGVYHFPRQNTRLGLLVPPDPDDIAGALARQLGARIAPSGGLAANQLGLSTQVPASMVYHTDGRGRTLQVGKMQVQLKHVPPKEMPSGSPTSAAVFQALRFIGPAGVDDDVVAKLRARLTPAQRRALARDAKYAAGWMMEVARKVADTAGGNEANKKGEKHG